jgi:hypothetical protein
VKSAFEVAAVTTAVAGCGGSHHAGPGAIRAALAASKASYLHYRSPVWWGRPSPARLVLVGSTGNYGLAHVTLSSGPKVFRSQWALLESKPGGWRVLDVNQPRAHDLGCRAPAAVMRALAGGCAHVESFPAGAVTGPTALRPASPSELAAITKVARRIIFQGRDSCVTYVAHLSKIDPHYARVAYEFHKPYRNCAIGNGESIFERTARGWKHLGDASEPFPCTYLPAGVVRSLFGECWIS